MAHPDLQALVDSLLPFAQSLMGKHGDFHPLGAFMSSDGSIRWIAAHTGEEFPPGQELIDLMVEEFRAQAASGEIRATAICYDALIIPPGETAKSDSIAFILEHRSGEAMDVFLPYVKERAGEVTYGDMFATARNPEIFRSRVQ